jgi:hypothetical protein
MKRIDSKSLQHSLISISVKCAPLHRIRISSIFSGRALVERQILVRLLDHIRRQPLGQFLDCSDYLKPATLPRIRKLVSISPMLHQTVEKNFDGGFTDCIAFEDVNSCVRLNVRFRPHEQLCGESDCPRRRPHIESHRSGTSCTDSEMDCPVIHWPPSPVLSGIEYVRRIIRETRFEASLWVSSATST